MAICPEVLGARLAACACHGRLTVAGVDIRPRRTHSKGVHTWENDRPVRLGERPSSAGTIRPRRHDTAPAHRTCPERRRESRRATGPSGALGTGARSSRTQLTFSSPKYLPQSLGQSTRSGRAARSYNKPRKERGATADPGSTRLLCPARAEVRAPRGAPSSGSGAPAHASVHGRTWPRRLCLSGLRLC